MLHPALIEALKDEKEVVRRYSALILGNIGESAAVAVPALIKAMGDENLDVRHHVISALGRIGKLAAAAVPALIQPLCAEAHRLNYDTI